MRYFMSIMPPPDLKPEQIPQGLMDAMGPWMEKSLANGTLISTGGLKPATEGKRLIGAAGEIVITDGPFAESKEVVGGYAVFEAADLESAASLASAFMQMHIDHGLSNMVLELREIAGGANY
nr:YciI family protein [uncultured Devosia sp.]